jgi:hypothetical protein
VTCGLLADRLVVEAGVARTYLAITVELVHGVHTGDLWPRPGRVLIADRTIGQDVVALPVPLPERGDHEAYRLSGTVRVLLERGQHQSPKACRPFSGTAGPVISTTAMPSSKGTLTLSEMRVSSVLNSSSGFAARVTAGIKGAYRAAPSLGLRGRLGAAACS